MSYAYWVLNTHLCGSEAFTLAPRDGVNRTCPRGVAQFTGRYICLHSATWIRTSDVSYSRTAKRSCEGLSRRLVLLPGLSAIDKKQMCPLIRNDEFRQKKMH